MQRARERYHLHHERQGGITELGKKLDRDIEELEKKIHIGTGKVGYKIHVCPECGARSDEFRFSPVRFSESLIREHDDYLECKKCYHTWDK